MLYQATLHDKIHFEAETTAQLHNDILNAELETLPLFHV